MRRQAVTPFRDPQDAAPVDTCGSRRCRGDIYPGETMFLYEDRWLCPDCFRAEIEGILSRDPRTLALGLGLDMRYYP